MANNKQNKTKEAPQGVGFQVCNIPVSEIHPSDENPRQNMDEESVKELAESIKIYGVLQPVIIRPDEDFGTEASPWEMVCGHRRLKACELLGLETIPAIIRDDMSDDEAYDLMIVENLQRQDLSPLDEAVAYKALYDGFPTTGRVGVTIQELAVRFGKSEKYIRGRLSLNDLIPDLKECLKAGTLTLGAALRLAVLPEKMQAGFYEDRCPLTAENDKNEIVAPMGVGDVSDYLSDESCDITRQAFSEDAEEKWNTKHHKCVGCPFNSTSQGALFADMVLPGECSNPDCLHSKSLAYARYIIDYWLPNFRSGDQMIAAGDMTVAYDSDPWFARTDKGDEQKKLFKTLRDRIALDGIKPIKTNRLSRIWNDSETKIKDNAFRVLDLADLCRGSKDYVKYYEVPSQVSDPTLPKEVTHSTIYSKLLTAKSTRDDKIYESLQPIGAAAIESYFSTVTIFQDLPYFLQLFVACRLIDNMSYSDRAAQFGLDCGYGVDGAVICLQKHTIADILKITLTSYTVENASSSGKRLLVEIIEALADDTTKATIEEIRNKFQPKIDALVQQLHDMGYDEHDNPLQADEPDDESNENDEAES